MTAMQNVNGAVSITNVQPPPEGFLAALLTFGLSASQPSVSQSLQLSSQGGLLLSQVVSLSIDNSQNAYPILVTHGALNEVVQIAANATVIIPTFSGRGPYNITVATLGGVAPSSPLTVQIVFLNYPRQSGTFSATQQSTIAATGQNTSSLLSGVFYANGNGNVFTSGVGNYVVDSLDIAVDGVESAVAGQMTFIYVLSCGGVSFAAGVFMTTIPAGAWQGGASINAPIQRTWPQGIIFPRASAFSLDVSSAANMQNAYFRCNISGLNTP